MATRLLEKGIRAFVGLSPTDKQWVVSSLRTAITPGPQLNSLSSFLSESPRRTRRPVVFVSHSHTDKPFVRSLATRLDTYGIDVWLDERELRIGDSLIEKLGRSIDEVDFVLVVLSPSSVKSRWVQEELRVALSNQIRRHQITVLPLLKGKCSVPAFLRDRLYADFTTSYRRAKNMPNLVESIMAHFRARRAMRAAPDGLLESR